MECHRYQDLSSSCTCKRSCFDVLLGASIELYQPSGMTSKVNKGPEDQEGWVQSPACPAVKLQIVVPAHLSLLFKAPVLYQHESSTRQGQGALLMALSVSSFIVSPAYQERLESTQFAAHFLSRIPSHAFMYEGHLGENKGSRRKKIKMNASSEASCLRSFNRGVLKHDKIRRDVSRDFLVSLISLGFKGPPRRVSQPWWKRRSPFFHSSTLPPFQMPDPSLLARRTDRNWSR